MSLKAVNASSTKCMGHKGQVLASHRSLGQTKALEGTHSLSHTAAIHTAAASDG